jgi:HAD superfamily hydrolase (TIGR01662 family)
MLYFSEGKAPEMAEMYRSLYRQFRDEGTTVFDGVIETLESIQEEGIKMAVFSNKGSSGIKHALEMFKMEMYFNPVIAVTDVEKKKPDPEGLEKIIATWGCTPQEILFIGDSDNDILCANRAGVPSVLVDWTIIPEESFEELEITYRVATPADLLNLIKFQD